MGRRCSFSPDKKKINAMDSDTLTWASRESCNMYDFLCSLLLLCWDLAPSPCISFLSPYPFLSSDFVVDNGHGVCRNHRSSSTSLPLVFVPWSLFSVHCNKLCCIIELFHWCFHCASMAENTRLKDLLMVTTRCRLTEVFSLTQQRIWGISCWTSGLNNLRGGWIKFHNFPTNKL